MTDGESGWRSIPTTNIYNFRDYGGYPVKSGGRLVRGMLFRSGDHSSANSVDLATVARLKLSAVVDLRSKAERDESPNRLPSNFDGHVYFGETFIQGNAPHLVGDKDGQPVSPEEIQTRYVDLYRQLPFREPIIEILRGYFAALSQSPRAILVHCMAGKDRTGIAVALFQRLMGVSLDDTLGDYLLTNTLGDVEARIVAQTAYMRAHNPSLSTIALKTSLSVEPMYLLAFLEAIEAEYLTIPNYVNDVLGISTSEQSALRTKFVTQEL